MSHHSALFVTFEGIEGSGKSTLARWLVDALQAAGQAALYTFEPGDSEAGRTIRSLLLDPSRERLDGVAELLLYCADRAQHVARVIRPTLARGVHVVCDRFSDATRAYQGHGRNLGRDQVERVNLADLPPQLTVLLDLPAEVGLERARRRNTDRNLEHESRFETEELAFHHRVRQGYLEIARTDAARVHVLDATRTLAELRVDLIALMRDTVGLELTPRMGGK